jgi:hypothetical protein
MLRREEVVVVVFSDMGARPAKFNARGPPTVID